MSREDFIEEFKNATSKCDHESERKQIQYMIDHTASREGTRGTKTLVIVMEELAELVQEVSKAYRGKIDYFNMLQEMGDVVIALESLQDIFGISDEDLQRAKNVKLKRNMKRVEEKLDENNFN